MEVFFYLELNREVHLITFYIMFTFACLIPELLGRVGSTPLIDKEILLWYEITAGDNGKACAITSASPSLAYLSNFMELYICNYIFLNKNSLCFSNSNTGREHVEPCRRDGRQE